MALIFGDSFSHYGTADLLKKWSSAGGSGARAIVTDVAPPGAMASLSIASNNTPGYLTKTLPSTYTTFVYGFWFYCSAATAINQIVHFLDGATLHIALAMDATGHLQFIRNATVLATSANAMSATTWYHIEMKVTIGDAGDAPSGRYQVKVDGSDWIADSGTGQDTRNAGNANISVLKLFGAGNAQPGIWVTDIYLLDTSGAVANDFLGPCRFHVLRPEGVGYSAQWTGNFADNFINVRDRHADGDATFNQDSTAGHIDAFEMTDVPAGTVHALQHVIEARRDAGAARVIRPITRIGGTNYNGTSFTMAASHLFYCDPVSVSPATGGATAWDDAEVDGAEFGYELVS
jgi:hypothetical protein